MASTKKPMKERSRQDTVLLGEALNMMKSGEGQAKKTPDQEYVDFVFRGSHIFSQRNPDIAKEIWAENVACFGITKGAINGTAANEAMSFAMHDATDDFHYIIEDIISSGTLKDGKCVHRYKIQGTWSRPLFGLEPTGKTFTLGGMAVWHVKQSKIESVWLAADYSECPELGKYLGDFLNVKM